ncbi:MAG: FadR family transcriptional regulator [Lachnospiraceae bacterium]|jgi:GntR family transcriptional repressor for pyruvate dehydrogenase complex|nr:FadR family transcriptional regulator [Lachnospiraceae bacterium]
MARSRLSDDIFRDLKNKIIAGNYKVNEKLPPERQLAEQYATSRIPVRGAIRLLAEQGFVKSMAGSGTVVISQGNALFEEEGESVIHHAPIEIGDTRVLLETIRLRCLIESEAARLAAVNRTTEDIKKIQSALFDSINEIRKLKLKENNAFFDADHAFHQAILKASKSKFLMDTMNTMPLLVRSHQFWSLKYTTPRDEVVSFHTQIYESILDENESKAYEAMRMHLSRVESLITMRNGKGVDERKEEGEEEI